MPFKVTNKFHTHMKNVNTNSTSNSCTTCNGEGKVLTISSRMVIGCSIFGGMHYPSLMQYTTCPTCAGTGEAKPSPQNTGIWASFLGKIFFSLILVILSTANVKGSTNADDGYLSECKLFDRWVNDHKLSVAVVGNEDAFDFEFIFYDCGTKYRFVIGCTCWSAHQGLLVIPDDDWNRRVPKEEIEKLKEKIESAQKNGTLLKAYDDEHPCYKITCS